jgi:soluble lytic murein transglycosylase-like protein
MDMVGIILNAAKMAHVSGILLLAICTHESGGFTNNYNPNDKGTPSIGSCQVKEATANFLGFRGNPKKLMNPKINAQYAAKYLQFQQTRYGNDWVKLVASYNAGSYKPGKIAGCPRNLTYVRLVQKKLSEDYKNKLDCGEEIAGNP